MAKYVPHTRNKTKRHTPSKGKKPSLREGIHEQKGMSHADIIRQVAQKKRAGGVK